MKIGTGTCLAVWIVASLGLGVSAGARAQSSEEEPNDTCDEAQQVGEIGIPFTLDGELDESADADIDFYRFVAEPGIELSVEQGGQMSGSGTLDDPFLGWLDSACRLRSTNDDYYSLDSRLFLTVPPDGEFVIAASSCCDGELDGSGFSKGSYRLSISEAPPAIGSISALAADAITGVPLPGDRPPFASFELYRCSDGDCSTSIAWQSADSEGRVSFFRDWFDGPLRVGTYRVMAYADEYDPAGSEPFAVGAGEDFDLGSLFLDPPPISLSGIEACEPLPSEGGACRYEVRINNNTPDPVHGLVWSLVSGFGLDSRLGYTEFEASPGGLQDQVVLRRRFGIDAFDGQAFGFAFTVPSSVPDGATFCARLNVGLGADPLYGTTAGQFLFCVEKSADGTPRPLGWRAAAKLHAERMLGNWVPTRVLDDRVPTGRR